MTLSPELKSQFEATVNNNKVVLFMKGSKDFPQCGFSARVAQVLEHLEVDYTDINVLENDEVREGIKEFSDWPTIPQLYVDGEFIGGCDITMQLFQEGQLQALLQQATE